MRKILFFLCALWGSVSSAWSAESGFLLDGLTCYIWNASKSNSFLSSQYKYASSKDNAAKFTLKAVSVGDDDELYYTIFNEDEQKFVNFTSTESETQNVLTNSDAVTDNSYWSIVWGESAADGNTYEGFIITPKGGSNVSWNYFGGNSVGSSIGLWNSSENGAWRFDVIIEYLGDKACTFKSNDRGAWAVSGSDATNMSSTGSLKLAYSATDTKQQFALVPFKGNYYLYSIAAEKFVQKDGKLSTENADAVTIMSTGNADYPFKFKFDDSHYINLGGSNQLTIDTWSTTDKGNSIAVLPQGEYSLDAAKQILNKMLQPMVAALIEEANGILSMRGVPGYPTDEAMNELEQVVNAEVESTNYDTAYDNLTSAIAKAWTKINYTPKTDVYYTITNAVWGTDGSRGSMIYNPDAHHFDTTNNNADYIWSTATVGVGDNKYPATSLNDQDPNHLWGFIQGEDGNYYMYNVGKKQFATVGKGTYSGDNGNAGTWIFSDTPSIITMNDGDNHTYTAPNVRFQATIPSTGEVYNMSMSNQNIGPFITYYTDNDGGVPMRFAVSTYAVDEEVTEHIKSLIENVGPYRDALQAVIDGIENLKLGDGLGQYSESEDYKVALANAKAEVDNDNATKASLTEAREALETAIAELSLNMPETGTFLRITGASGKSIAGGAMTSGTFSMTDATDATTIFYYDGTHLTNLGTGMSNALKNSGWNWVYGTENASEVTFGDGATSGGYTIKSHDVYMYDRGNESAARVDRGAVADANIKTSDVKYRSWELAYVNELPIALTQVGESYYATLCSPVALTISDVQAYIATAASEGKLTLDKVEGTIPANEPVILVGASATAEFAIAEGNTEAVTGNLLSGSATGGTTAANSILTLQSHEDEAGFYVYTGTGIPAFKAYLSLESLGEAGIKGFTFDFGTTDGIATVEGETTEGAAIYNLAGQRVEKAVKGVYIINGKKVLVK